MTLGWYIQTPETAEKCNEAGTAGSRGKEEGKDRLDHFMTLTHS